MEQTIDISNLPQTPSICNQILKLVSGRQGELAGKWKISQAAVSYQLTNMKEGKRLTPKTWNRYAELYIECLKVQEYVRQYEIS